MGGVGKYKKKSENLVELCTNFEELGGIWEYHQIFSPKSVVWGGGIVGNWVANFRKNGVWGRTTIMNGSVPRIRRVLQWSVQHRRGIVVHEGETFKWS